MFAQNTKGKLSKDVFFPPEACLAGTQLDVKIKQNCVKVFPWELDLKCVGKVVQQTVSIQIHGAKRSQTTPPFTSAGKGLRTRSNSHFF